MDTSSSPEKRTGVLSIAKQLNAYEIVEQLRECIKTLVHKSLRQSLRLMYYQSLEQVLKQTLIEKEIEILDH